MQEVYTPLPIGTIVRGQYVVEDVLDKGEFSVVYLARDKRSNQSHFSLKEVIAPKRKQQQRVPDAAIVLKRLNHFALPHIYDVFNDAKQGRVYMLMDYIEGESLEVLQPEQRFSLPEVMTFIAPIVEAVSYLHNQHPPLIHGNIKPSNIIKSRTDSKIILVGFDLTKEFDSDTTTAGWNTPGYTAPEQYSRRINPRTDIYALGAVLYTLLTSTVPPDALYRSVQRSEKKPDPLIPMDQIIPAIPKTVARAIYRAMAMSTEERFSTVEWFWDALWQVSDANSVMQQITETAAMISTEENAELDTNPLAQKIAEPLVTTEKVPKSDAGIVVQQISETGIAPSTEANPAAGANIAMQGAAESAEQAEEVPGKIINSKMPQLLESEDEGPTETLSVVRVNPVMEQTPELLVETEHPPELDTNSIQQRTPEAAVVPSTALEPSTISQQEEPLVPVSLQEQPHGYRGTDGGKRKDVKRLVSIPGKQALALLILILILLGSLGIGISIWFYATSHHRPISTPPSSAHQSIQTFPLSTANLNPTVTSTPAPVSSPNIATQYTGTLHDIPTGTTINISFSRIRQQQENISGYFSTIPANTPFNGILQNGPFTGTINTAKQLQFIVTNDTGQASFSFDGVIQPDRTIAGTYCSLGEATGKCSDYGLWSVSPAI